VDDRMLVGPCDGLYIFNIRKQKIRVVLSSLFVWYMEDKYTTIDRFGNGLNCELLQIFIDLLLVYPMCIVNMIHFIYTQSVYLSLEHIISCGICTFYFSHVNPTTFQPKMSMVT
jgi:hypothetical protein